MTHPHAVLLGVPIDGYTMTQTLDRVAELVIAGRARNRTHQISTVNVDFLVNAIDDPAVMAILQQSDVNLADGMPLVWAARLLGLELPERVAGADLVPALAKLSAERRIRVHLFGAAPGVADRARLRMLEGCPNASITADAGPSSIDPSIVQPEVIDSIGAAAPDILCVALGNPKQELFIDTYRDLLPCPVMIGVGGSLDMVVGDKKRAPRWLQRVGGEWIFRALQEPGRLGRRYGRDVAVFGPQLIAYVRTVRTYRHGVLLCSRKEAGGRMIVEPAPAGAAPTLGTLHGVTELEVDLTGVTALHPAAHSELVRLLRAARTHDVSVGVLGVSNALRSCLDGYGTAIMVECAEPS